MKRLFMMMNVAGCIFCSMAAVKVSETFGYDPIDSTRFLQAALDSSHTEIIVDVQGGDWVTLPLVGKSNKTIIFEDGAWIRAKRGEFKGLYDILIRFGNCTNVTIRGGGNPRNCGFRMWRDDYDDKSRYQHSEWSVSSLSLSFATIIFCLSAPISAFINLGTS